MFDNTKPNIILCADMTDVVTMQKTLGPYKVAHVLRQAGFQVAVIHHLSVFSIDEILHMLEHMVSEHTLFVGFSNFFYADISQFYVDDVAGLRLKDVEPGSLLPHGRQYNTRIKDKIKTANKNCKLVLGGPTATDTDYNAIFDYLVIGYAESSVVNLAQHLLDPTIELQKSYRSLHGPIIVNDSRAEGYDFSACTMRYEDHDVVLPGETLQLEVARGCIFKCAFCSYPMNGKKKLDFIRNMDLIYDELVDNYQRFGVTRYEFCDDTVNDSPQKCEMLYEMSRRLPFQLEWWGYIRLDLLTAHPATVDWLFGSGLRAAYFGIETLHPPTGKAVGKGGDRQRLLQTVKDIKDRYGDSVSLHGAFIHGLPHEPMSSMLATTDFLFSAENPLDTWNIRPLRIKPNTQVYTSDFISDIDKNWQKYGYRSDGIQKGIFTNDRIGRSTMDNMLWSNEHTNRQEVEQLCRSIEKRKIEQGKERLPGQYYLAISSLTQDLSIINKPYGEIDWHRIDRAKLQKAQKYKRRLYDQCGVPPKFTKSTVLCFSDWIKNRLGLDTNAKQSVN